MRYRGRAGKVRIGTAIHQIEIQFLGSLGEFVLTMLSHVRYPALAMQFRVANGSNVFCLVQRVGETNCERSSCRRRIHSAPDANSRFDRAAHLAGVTRRFDGSRRMPGPTQSRWTFITQRHEN
jgi:hypothetical protein